MRFLADALYGLRNSNRINLYRILSSTLEPLRGLAPFQAPGESRNRLERLIHFGGLPSLSQTLEYSALNAAEALERSVFHQLSSELGSYSPAQVQEAVHSVFSALSFPSDAGPSTRLTPEAGAFQNLRFQIDQVLQGRRPDRGRLARLFSAVLHRLFGEESGLASSLRAYWNGQLRDVTIVLAPQSRRTLQSVLSWLSGLERAAPGPERVALPLVEGATCLAGGGLLAWGALAAPARGAWNIPLVVGGGVTGLGCGALGTHFAIPTRNRYAADAIGGGVGAVIGVGIPILIQLLGGQLSAPLDGRNPTTGRGP